MTAYELRIMRWSADVCSADLDIPAHDTAAVLAALAKPGKGGAAGRSTSGRSVGPEPTEDAPAIFLGETLKEVYYIPLWRPLGRLGSAGSAHATDGLHRLHLAGDRKSTRLNSSH